MVIPSPTQINGFEAPPPVTGLPTHVTVAKPGFLSALNLARDLLVQESYSEDRDTQVQALSDMMNLSDMLEQLLDRPKS